ncbi:MULTISPECIES: LacI family DNA-binding transcriptional regulator [unclassified Rhizobium]|uniref:LacI family DNA-binding transcriptional regulator n=1 Tax=unclassified Rhizobium TaxID=2613769 RepID=UPI001C82F18F|nr:MULTISPECIES: LacI family DNA-binding transcriptional regulator [unclassified Rhizobium]MBX5217749.1 LacI family DNA-binding transcriptional regulator [Rhizobium sp. NLR9a]MBX5241799.1 LacI family DNA-binding transcriptional regulator [Rhizobium sp. NLR22b]MBX5244785.1 LacI family DNA-binding transcriptional regulator [Rhizobium sp. NLR3b]MBX5276610.1 LacI family DNA-binding transcriptional regulator [Rhizobium sp. NLR13a]MBX5282368.1 LacI family DNA-binding transcriptional regulator [Rhizo
MRRITLDDVANLAGVSPITVSRVLRKPHAVSPALRLRVDAAIKELGYVPNIAASRLASARTHAIGVIVPTLYNVIFAEYLFALHDVLVAAGFQVIVVNSRYSEIEEENAIKALLGQGVEAIIITGTHHTPLSRQLLAQAHLPVVETFELSADPIDLNIGMSQEQAGQTATQHLIERGLRRIAFLTGNLDHRAQSRFDGYRAAMQQADLPNMQIIAEKPRYSSVALGSNLFAITCAGGEVPEAIFCTDDNLALGAMQECRKRGIRVPDDIAIMGFHDLEFAACAAPSLSSVLTRRFETGKLAAEKVLTALTSSVASKGQQIDLGYALIPRESTAT